MKFNNFIDKTLKAAKQSAQQMYGDDFSKLKEITSEDEEQEREFSDRQKAFDKGKKQSKKELAETKAPKGVVFERSGPVTRQKSKKESNEFNRKLDAIRKYAAEQSNGNENENSGNPGESDIDKGLNKPEDRPKIKIPKPVNELYSRKDICPREMADKTDSEKQNLQQIDNKGEKNPRKKPEADSKELYDQLVKDLPNSASNPGGDADHEEEQASDKQDLQNRLKRLESLVEGKLSFSGDERADHPIYHKLMERGVPQQLIRSWFDAVKQEGIDANQQRELFRSKMLHLISKQLHTSQAGPAAKMILFTGRSGSGKSHLILKLVTLAHFLETDNIAVVSFVPEKKFTKQNYSIIKPFCHNNNIDFYQIDNAKEAASYHKKWKSYDHILIETPALETGGHSLITSISKLKDELQSQATVETHYLVNTSVQGVAFNDPLAKEIAADHITLTHIDQSTKWGKAIPLLFNTDYKLRYISCGPSLSGDLLPFDAKKFTRKLLRA